MIRNYEFNEDFNRLLREAELRSKLEAQAPKKMKTFEESRKSQKTVASLKIDKNEKNKEGGKNAKKGGGKNKEQRVVEEGNGYFTLHYITLAPNAPIMMDAIVTLCDFQICFNSCFSSWYFSFFLILFVFHSDVKWIITIIFYLLISFLY